MNDAGKKAIENALGGVEDDLARALHQQSCNRNFRSGNGVHIDAMIATYERQRDALREALRLCTTN
jgi:hypothetical protein